MKHLFTLVMLLTVWAATAQNSQDLPEGPIASPPYVLGKTAERSPRYNSWNPANHHGSASRSDNVAFTLDYGLLDYSYNENILAGAGYWYSDDQFSFRLINSRLPVDSTEYRKWAITWYPKIFDMDNNTSWPHTEYGPNRVQMSIDTIFMTFGHLHLSNRKDTLVISVWDIDAFTSINFDTGATGLLYGRMTLITDTSFLGGTGEGSSPNTFMLANHYPFVPSSPIVIPRGKRFLVQVDYYGPVEDAFLLSSSRRNDCASQCGASTPYVNATFNANIANWNSLTGDRYIDPIQNIRGVYPSTLFFKDCNNNGAKDSICEENYAQNSAIYPHIAAYIPDFYVEANADQANACNGNTVTLTANGGGGTPPYTYEWVAGSGSLSSTSDQQVALTMPNNVINDTVIVTLIDANNQRTKDTIVVNTGGISLAIINSPQPIVLQCSNSVVITTNISGYTVGKNYMWNTGEQGAFKSSVTATSAGTYSLTVTNGAGCSASASVQVVYGGTTNTVNFNAPLSLGVRQWAGCPMPFYNTSISADAPWVATFDPTGTGSDVITITDGNRNIEYTYTSPGVYPAKLTMDSAGCSFSKVSNITIITKPQNQTCDILLGDSLNVSLGQSTATCAGNTLTLSAVVSRGYPPYSYSWSATGDPLSCTTCKNPLILVTQNSVYRITVTDDNGNTATASVVYSLRTGGNAMSLAFSNTPINCNTGGTTQVTVTNGTPPYAFNWGDGKPVTNGLSPATHDYTVAKSYIVTVTDSIGCQASQPNAITTTGVNATLAQTVQPTCSYDNTGSLRVTGAGGTAPYTYKWGNGATTDQVSNLRPGRYWLTITDANSCSALNNYLLTSIDKDLYVFVETTNSNCGASGIVRALPRGGQAPYTYLWSNGSTVASLTGISTGSYAVTVGDGLGCTTKGNGLVTQECHGVITGTVFDDTDNDCIPDSGEKGVGEQYITAYNITNNGYYYGYTDSTGRYYIDVNKAGTYTLDYYDYYGQCSNNTLCNNPTGTVTLTTMGDTIRNNNVAINSTSGFDLSFGITWNASNPGFLKTYKITPYNLSPNVFNGIATVTFVYDSTLIYQSSYGPQPMLNLPGHTLTWLVTDIYDYYRNTNGKVLEATFMVPLSVGLNYPLKSIISISPTTGDCDTTNNKEKFQQITTGSYDPNEKEVTPANVMYEDETKLTYTIHFQNTGTDSTHFVIIRDTLSPDLNPATARTLATSHPLSKFDVSKEGVLTWTFDPLRLVDSITDPEGSQGFITFSIERRTNRSVGTIIKNSAAIYFDYNEPVITNTVVDTISVRPTDIPTLLHDELALNLFPNPASTKLFINAVGFIPQWISVYDMNGRKVSEQRYTPQIDITQLSAGLYFIEAKGATEMMRKKFIKQ